MKRLTHSVFPHPVGPATTQVKACFQVGSMLSNEDWDPGVYYL